MSGLSGTTPSDPKINIYVEFKENHPVIAGIIKTTVNGGLAFGVGMIFASIGKLSPLSAIISGVSLAIITGSCLIADNICKKYGIEESKIILITASIQSVILVAGMVATIFLGIISPENFATTIVFTGIIITTVLVDSANAYLELKEKEKNLPKAGT